MIENLSSTQVDDSIRRMIEMIVFNKCAAASGNIENETFTYQFMNLGESQSFNVTFNLIRVEN